MLLFGTAALAREARGVVNEDEDDDDEEEGAVGKVGEESKGRADGLALGRAEGVKGMVVDGGCRGGGKATWLRTSRRAVLAFAPQGYRRRAYRGMAPWIYNVAFTIHRHAFVCRIKNSQPALLIR